MKYILLVFSFFSVFLAVPQVHAATNGSLIKSSSNSSVYYLVDGKRYAFPNEKVFFSWYDNFSGVITISPSELASYQLAGNVTYRPGRFLVKIQTDPKVYAVSRYSQLRWIESEPIASTLYGSNWATKVHDVPDTFFINYQIATPIAIAQEYSPTTELAVTQIAQNILGATVPPVESTPTNPISVMEHKAFDLVNQHRGSIGLSTLTWSDTVANVARGHSANMANGSVAFGHDGFDARYDLLNAQIPNFTGAAENVAYNGGYDDPATIAVDGWLHSPGHLENIETAAYSLSGMGVVKSADGDYYFTQLFASVH